MKKNICHGLLGGLLIVLSLAACSNKEYISNSDPIVIPEVTQAAQVRDETITGERADKEEEMGAPETGAPETGAHDTGAPETGADAYEEAVVPESDIIRLTDTIFPDKDETYKKMIESSLITTGNNYRMKKAIERAKNGEDVTIAYIGGSITEGAGASVKEKCYAYLSYQYFKKTFGKDDGKNVKFVNAGMGGTPSALGVIRYDRDVTSYGKVLPDVVFIEFSVNDYQEPTKGVAFESMVRNILNAPNQPAVVLLFCVFQSQWNMQGDYIPIGYYYDLPMISIRDAVVPELKAGRITDKQFFADIYHPTDFGHSITADCISYYFSTVDADADTDKDIEIPSAARFGQAFVGIKMYDRATVDDNVKVTEGGFSGKDSALVRFATGQPSFPENWMHNSSSGDVPFKMTLNCKNLLFVYKSGGSYGTAEVYVDGQLTQTLDATQGGGWNNPITVLLINDTVAAEHTIEVKMLKGHEGKSFTIMAVGYTQ